MADDTTLIINIQTLLKGLEKTLKGLDALEKKLKSVGKGGGTDAVSKSIARNAAAQQRAVEALQRQRSAALIAENRKQQAAAVALQKQRSAAFIAQEKKQEQASIQSFQRRLNALSVAEKRRTAVIEREAKRRQTVERNTEKQNLRDFNASIKRINRAEQVRIKAQQSAFAKAPQVDAHVRAFRNLEQANTAAAAAAAASVARFQALGNSLRSIGQGVTTLGFGLTAGLTIPLVAFGKSALDAAVTLDSLKRGLTAIVGSAAQAEVQLARLTEIAKLPGIGFQEAIQGSIRLQAVGFSAADAEKSLREFSNAVALTGGGREELSRITVQLGQLAAKGKVLSQDLRPIIEAAPAVGRALKNAFGTVNADDIAELSGSSQEFLKILTAELERLPRAAAGAKNTFENFRDEVFRTSAAVGDALIPVFTRLIEIVGPAIVKLADGFSKLSTGQQTFLLGIGAFAAALGPLAIGLGFVATGVGRVAVGLAQMNTLGLIPSIASLKAFNTAAAATIARLLGLRAATVAAAGPWVALAAAVGTVAAAYLLLSQSDTKITTVTDEQLNKTKQQIDALKEQISFLLDLNAEVKRTADEQEKLDKAYRSLNVQAQARVQGIKDEQERLGQLITEIDQILKLREQEREQQTAVVAAALANAAAQTAADERRIDSITRQIQSNTQIIQSIEQLGHVNADARKALALQNIEGGNAIDIADRLRKQNQQLIETQNGLRDSIDGPDGTNDAARKQAAILESLGITNAEQARKFLTLAKAMNLFKGDIEATIPVIERFIQTQRDATPAVDGLTEALRRQNAERRKGVEVVEKVVKDRQQKIKDNVLIAKEASDSFEGARKNLDAFIKASPELRRAIQTEAQQAGKTFEEFVKEALEPKGGSSRATALRNAQEALADASAKVSQESAEKQIALEKFKNDELLRLNDSRFQQEIISYQEFIGERSRLQQLELQGEIDRQKKIAELAADDVARQQQRAGTVSGAEQTRALAQVETSKAKQIEAEIKILDLQSRQKDIAADAQNELRQFNKERLRDFRELSRELDEILGKEKAAGEAAIDERFRETLIALNNEMALAQRILRQAALDQDTARIAAARSARDQIQSQKTSIENHIIELKAVNSLRAAQEDIARAEERQTNLEKELAFQVEFRGINERFALQKRLEGEKLVREEYIKQQAVLQGVIDRLKRLGLEVPQQLIAGLERFRVAAKGLGEVSFADQFKQAEEDLIEVSDRLADKIADVERAVRSRTISELEGRLIIRRLNNEEIGELEAKLEVLKKIAAQSDDPALKRQAAAAQQSIKDKRAEADELKNFNKQLKSVAVDSFADSLSQLFKDLRDNTESATQDILNFFNNILNRVNDFIAENLAQRIAESLFPDPNAPDKEGGIGGFIKGIFGVGGKADPVTAANTTATDANTAAINNLTTTFGGQAAGSSAGGAFGGVFGGLLGGGGSTAQTGGFLNELGGLVSGLGINVGGVLGTSAAAGSTVIEALNINSDWLAKVADALTQNTQALQSQSGQGGGLQGLASLFGEGGGGAATGDFISAAPKGRMIRVAEAGYDEAILTTDPKHSMRQAAILREFLKQTRGLYGRFKAIPEYAAGGIVSAQDAESNLLASMHQRSSLAAMVPSEVATRSDSAPALNLRNINLFDRRAMVRGHLRSAEGATDILNVISENADEIGRRIRVR
jgi:tape measure domain-containing protein